MRGSSAYAALLIACLLSSVLVAQRTMPESFTGAPFVGPMAITGSPSSARHCVSGQAANVHGLGWVQSGTNYTITFDSDIALVAAISRMDFNENQAVAGYGSPDIRLTASTSGTMALLVSGNGRAGCYRYKVEIQPPAASTPSGFDITARGASFARAPVQPAKSPIQMTAISGAASSAKLCVGGNGVARVHAIGRVEAGTRVSIAFDSDFDAKAGIGNVDLVSQQGTFSIDDNSGGNLNPQLDVTMSHAGTLVLYVAGASGSQGCYRYRVDVTPTAVPPSPAPSPTPTPVPTPTPAPAPTPGASFAGTWRGQVQSTACFDDGVLEGICASFPRFSDPLVLLLSQNGSAVSGTINLGGTVLTVSGNVQGNRLSIAGRGTVATGVEMSVEDWNTSVSGSSMTGSFSIRMFPTASVSGSARWAMSLQSVSRTSSLASVVAADPGAAVSGLATLARWASEATRMGLDREGR